MKARLVFLFVIVVIVSQLKAQQTPLFNSALINPVLDNPAMAGFNKYSQGFLHYRKQWVDIEGAPESALFSIDWPLKDEKSGLALIISSDKTNILGHVGVMTAYSHDIKISSDQHLRLGLGIKLNHNTIYFDKVKAESQSEATLFNYFESATGFNANFGISYNYKGLRAGISAFNLINSKMQYSNATEEKMLYFQYIPQYLISVNYTHEFNDEISVRPEIALRDLQGMSTQLEASVFATYQKKYSAGVVFRNRNSLGFLGSMLIYDRLTVSYAYQSALGNLSGYNGGTHEVTLGYRFYTSHYQEYKPVNDQKLDEIIELAQKQIDENKQLEKANQKLKAEQNKLQEDLKNEKEEVNHLMELMEKERENFRQARLEDETDYEDLPEDLIHDPNVPIYIILGVFKDINSAKKFQQVLRREHQQGTEVLKRRNTNDYIVCVNKRFDSKNSLKKELSRLKRVTSSYSDSDVWIYVNK